MKPGATTQPVGVEHPLAGQARADLGDPVAVDGDVGDDSRRAGAVDDGAAPDDEVTHVVSHP